MSQNDTTLAYMTYKEIAKALNLDVTTVMNIEKRALRKLARFENRKRWEAIRETMGECENKERDGVAGDAGVVGWSSPYSD